MFGRMFAHLPPLDVPDSNRQALAAAMLDPNPDDGTLGNDNIPAGFTYLGQFVDHDITLDLTSLSDKKRDPLGLENFRTPALDLDSIYGHGPDGSPHLYARNPEEPSMVGPKLLIGKNITVPFGNVQGAYENDMPRGPPGTELIGHTLNAQNLLVAQTHLTLIPIQNQ